MKDIKLYPLEKIHLKIKIIHFGFVKEKNNERIVFIGKYVFDFFKARSFW